MMKSAWAILIVAALACEAKRETPPAGDQSAVIVGDERKSDSAADSGKGAPATANCGARVVTGDGIGRLRLGATVEAVRANCNVLSDTSRLADEGMRARILTVAFGVDTVEAEIDGERVWRIKVLSSRLRTADSLGVGTSLERLLQLKSARGITGEGRLYVISPEKCGLSFRLSDSGAGAASQNWDKAALSRLPKSTHVSEILIVGCARAPK